MCRNRVKNAPRSAHNVAMGAPILYDKGYYHITSNKRLRWQWWRVSGGRWARLISMELLKPLRTRSTPVRSRCQVNLSSGNLKRPRNYEFGALYGSRIEVICRTIQPILVLTVTCNQDISDALQHTFSFNLVGRSSHEKSPSGRALAVSEIWSGRGDSNARP